MCGMRMLQKRRYPRRLRRRRPTHLQPHRHRLQIPRRMVVQLKVRRLLRLPTPEVQVRLVPYLKLPRRQLIDPVPLHQVRRQCLDHRIPRRHILRRRHHRVIPERLRLIRVCRHLRRHKTQLHIRPYMLRQQPVIDLVHIKKVIDRRIVRRLRRQSRILRLPVGIVQPHTAVQNPMSPHRLEIRCLLHRLHIAAIVRTQRQDRPPRPKHLFPEVGKRCRRGLRIHAYPLRSLRGRPHPRQW